MASDAIGRAKNSKNTSHIQMIPEDFRCEKHVRNFRDETSSYDTGEKDEISKSSGRRRSSLSPLASSSRQTEVNSCRKNKKQKRCEFLNHLKDFEQGGDKIVRREHCLLPLKKENTSLTISLNRHLDKHKAEHGLTKQTRLQFQKSGNASELKISRASNKKDKNNNSETITDVQTLVPYLHHDIWFDILSWLSAICLYNIMSRVCNTWATIIRHPDFVEKHLLRSRSGIFIQGSPTRFLDLTNNNVEITYIKQKYPGVLRCSYQGVSLFYNNATKANYVVNPVTMQLAQISPPDYKYSSNDGYNVICDRCSGEFKLVFADQKWGGVCSWYVQKLGTENSWKKISGRHKFSRMDFPGLSVGGFIVYEQIYVGIVVLDVSDETIHKIRCPTKPKVSPVTYLPMGNKLTCISHDSNRIFIHILEDFHAGKWSLYKILGDDYIQGKPLKFLRFLGWINNTEELLVRLCTFDSCYKLGSCYKGSFYKYDSCCYSFSSKDKWIYFTYNLKGKRIRYLYGYMSEGDFSKCVFVHTNSLLSW